MENRTRRAAAYVVVMSVAMMVATIGLSALALARVERLSAGEAGDVAAARCYARAAIEIGLFKIYRDAKWRTSVSSGDWISKEAIGAGTMSLQVALIDDRDGNVYNDALDLTGVGVCGTATHRMRVRVQNGAVVASSGWTPIMASGTSASN